MGGTVTFGARVSRGTWRSRSVVAYGCSLCGQNVAEPQRSRWADPILLSRSIRDSIRSRQYNATCHARGCQIKSFLAGVLHGKIKTGPISVRARVAHHPSTQVLPVALWHARAHARTGLDPIGPTRLDSGDSVDSVDSPGSASPVHL